MKTLKKYLEFVKENLETTEEEKVSTGFDMLHGEKVECVEIIDENFCVGDILYLSVEEAFGNYGIGRDELIEDDVIDIKFEILELTDIEMRLKCLDGADLLIDEKEYCILIDELVNAIKGTSLLEVSYDFASETMKWMKKEILPVVTNITKE